MHIKLTPPTKGRLEQIQAFARRSPKLYGAQLATLAIGGDIVLTFVEVLPWAIGIAIGAIFFDHPVFRWGAVAAILLLVWLMRPTFQIGGKHVDRKTVPDLFTALADLQSQVGMRGRIDVHVDHELNASASETRGLFGVLGTRRVLTLGVPLLLLLSKDEVLAVIAHEFGHFSRRHGRLGQWLYRAHIGWLEHAYYVDASSSVMDRAAGAFASRFVPYFSALSYVHSRQCEYEADADGAASVGPDNFALALCKIAVAVRWFETRLSLVVGDWQRDEANAPDNFYERVTLAFTNEPTDRLGGLLKEGLEVNADWRATHPLLRERLNSLQQPAKFVATSRPCAGEALFGQAWDTILRDANGDWRKTSEISWRAQHLVRTRLYAPLLAEANGTDEPHLRRVERARVLRAQDPVAGRNAFKQLYESSENDSLVTYLYGEALLTDGDAAGLPLVEMAATQSAPLRLPAYKCLVRYFTDGGDAVQASVWDSHRDRAIERRRAAIALFLQATEQGELEAGRLGTQHLDVLSKTLEQDPDVVRGWLAEGWPPLLTASSTSSLPVRLLELQIRPTASEDAVTACYRKLLSELSTPDVHVIVRTHFETEPIVGKMATALDRLPDSVKFKS